MLIHTQVIAAHAHRVQFASGLVAEDIALRLVGTKDISGIKSVPLRWEKSANGETIAVVSNSPNPQILTKSPFPQTHHS